MITDAMMLAAREAAKDYMASNPPVTEDTYDLKLEGVLRAALTAAFAKVREPTTPTSAEIDSSEEAVRLRNALREAKSAVEFFDKVKNASEDEKIAVGTDHWDRVMAAIGACAAIWDSMNKVTTCEHCNNGYLGNRFGQDIECVNGILIDIDEFREGYQKDVCYPVAPCHPDWKKQCADENFVSEDAQERLAQACEVTMTSHSIR